MISQDRYLLKKLHRGDKAALRQIYEKYRDDLYTVAVSLSQDVHTSEDCLQDVFVGLVSSPDSFRVRYNLKAYLISCVANRVRDRMKKAMSRPDVPLEQLSSLAISDDPADEAIGREESGQVLNALSKLPFEQRETFVLHVQGELKFRQIAKLQYTSIKTVLSRYRYAIEKLRAILEKGK